MSSIDATVLQAQAQILAGNPELSPLPWRPFDKRALAFLDDLSRTINKSDQKQFPDLAALCFWLRRRHLESSRDDQSSLQHRLGTGIALHIAPSNVPLNFMYSFAAGLLAGNCNIVRLPTRTFAQAEIVLNAVTQMFSQQDHTEVFQRSLFIRYPAGSDLTAYLSGLSHARVIWGGDQTVNEIRALKSLPRTVDIPFANRYSLSLLGGAAIRELSDEALTQLCERFYNDSFTMDQQACSSPVVIAWLDDHIGTARQRFWECLTRIVEQRYTLGESRAVNKYTRLCQVLAETPDLKLIKTEKNHIYRLYSEVFEASLFQLRGDSGFFIETDINTVDDLFPALDERIQTLTCYGVDTQDLGERLMESGCMGVDRIVPVGQALAFDFLWDGMELISRLTRRISIQ